MSRGTLVALAHPYILACNPYEHNTKQTPRQSVYKVPTTLHPPALGAVDLGYSP